MHQVTKERATHELCPKRLTGPRLLACLHGHTPCRLHNNTKHNTKVSLSNKNVEPSGASTDPAVLFTRLGKLALPFWTTSEKASGARWRLAAVVGLTLATTGVSVMFNYLGRDFFNALSEKDAEEFTLQLVKYLGGFAVGIPIYVFKSYYQSKLSLEWRQWMTEEFVRQYMRDRTFYHLQNAPGVDNPDQRISSDIQEFSRTALALSLTLLNAAIDLVSFSGILYGIYPPLFLAMLMYAAGGTVASIALGKRLVGLNFCQEAREADFRYSLVRVRDNAEGVAFYQGEEQEQGLMIERLHAAVSNYLGLLAASRNLDFLTSFYRFVIQLLPAAVVAPLYFRGEIEFGVINQSQSAFNHVLSDMSLVVYQVESLAGFSAVVDRLGQFAETMSLGPAAATAAATATTTTDSAAVIPILGHEKQGASPPTATIADGGCGPAAGVRLPGSTSCIQLEHGADQAAAAAAAAGGRSSNSSSRAPQAPLLELRDLTLCTPSRSIVLLSGLDLQVAPQQHLLIMGPSGSGKTSLLRAVAGLWDSGSGSICCACSPQDMMFLPQRPYMVLGSLRDQVLYPRFWQHASTSPARDHHHSMSNASDEEVVKVLRLVKLGHLLTRYGNGSFLAALDWVADWASSLSLGEQQRLAWARLLVAKPRLALLDEATSALDEEVEAELYQYLARSNITYISVGHRTTLRDHHKQVLQLKAATSPPG